MDERLLDLYNLELRHLRETAAEFARDFPKIAGRLSLDHEAKEICPDPYVERLLEGCAFLTARVQLKLESQFPAFTQHLLEMVYPHYLAPTPSMALAQFTPDPEGGRLEKGYAIPVGTSLIGRMAREDAMAFILVEQHADIALALTQNAIVLERGRIAYQGASASLLADHAALDRLIGLRLAEV